MRNFLSKSKVTTSFWIVCILLSISFKGQAQKTVKGADISFYKQQNVNFKAWSGNDINWGGGKSLFNNLKDKSLNAVRIRIWVNSKNNNWWNSVAEAKIKAKEAADNGMYIMLTLHYSDNWAHPGQQATPLNWNKWNKDQIRNNIWGHTNYAVKQINSVASGKLKWVQIGNEIDTGMCFPTGQLFDGNQVNDARAKVLAEYVTAGNNAAKAALPGIITIAHSSRAENRWVLTKLYDALKKHGAKYDMIGLSLYPSSNWWNQTNAYRSNLIWLKNRYKLPVMLVEFGMPHQDMSKSFNALKAAIQITANNGGKGVFYWEPQAFNIGDGNHTWWNGTGGGPRWSLNAFLQQYSGVGTEWNLSSQLNWWKQDSSELKNSVLNLDPDLYTISPNPASDQISLYLPAGDKQSVSITDSTGKSIGTYSLSQIQNTIDISRLQQGIYILKISNENGDITKKFIKK